MKDDSDDDDDYHIHMDAEYVQEKKIQRLDKQLIKQTSKFNINKQQPLFGIYHPQLQKSFADVYNISRIWVDGVLYWKHLYPQKAFKQKNAYGKSIWTVHSQILKKYLDSFFTQVAKNIAKIHYIQLRILKQNNSKQYQVVQVLKLNFKINQGFNRDPYFVFHHKGNHPIQYQIQIKQFLVNLQQSYKKGFIKKENQKTTFKFFIGYYWDNEEENKRDKTNRSGLLQKWIKRPLERNQLKNFVTNLNCTNMSLQYFSEQAEKKDFNSLSFSSLNLN